jgi:ankyrin repeat protein
MALSCICTLAITACNKTESQRRDSAFAACRAGNCSRLIEIINDSVDIDSVDRAGNALLHIAASRGYDDIVRFLLERKACVAIPSAGGKHAIHSAASGLPQAGEARRRVVTALLRHGVDINAVDEHGKTALWWAFNSGDAGMIRYLLENDATLADYAKRSSAFHAIALGKTHDAVAVDDLLDLAALVSKEEIDTQDEWGDTPIQLAVKSGDAQLARGLLRRGADVDVLTANGNSLLHIAVQANDVELVKLLISHGADERISGQQGMTPPELAKALGHKEVLMLFHSAPE